MKCPKCHYLSFEPEPRCRNCGYDLSLFEPDLTLKGEEPTGPLADLELHVHAAAASDTSSPRRAVRSRAAAAVATPPSPARTETPAWREQVQPPVERAPRRRAAPTTELPLFVKGLQTDVAADEPGEAVPVAAPRPLAVQRRVPASTDRDGPPPAGTDHLEAPAAEERADRAHESGLGLPAGRVPSKPTRLGTFQRELLQDLERLERAHRRREDHQRNLPEPDDDDLVPPATRLAAATIDAGFLGTVAAAVCWLTLRWCGLGIGDAAVLPLVPMGTFVLLVVVGYLLLFTVAGGQTVGKMACGIRVVGDPPDDESSNGISIRQACLRAALTVPSVFALGAGFVPALVGGGRAFHDRFAHTRVVRV